MAIIQDPYLSFKGAGDFHPPGDEQQRDAARCAAGAETAQKDSNTFATSQTAEVNKRDEGGFVWVNTSQKLQEAAERLQKVRTFAQVEPCSNFHLLLWGVAEVQFTWEASMFERITI